MWEISCNTQLRKRQKTAAGVDNCLIVNRYAVVIISQLSQANKQSTFAN